MEPNQLMWENDFLKKKTRQQWTYRGLGTRVQSLRLVFLVRFLTSGTPRGSEGRCVQVQSETCIQTQNHLGDASVADFLSGFLRKHLSRTSAWHHHTANLAHQTK